MSINGENNGNQCVSLNVGSINNQPESWRHGYACAQRLAEMKAHICWRQYRLRKAAAHRKSAAPGGA